MTIIKTDRKSVRRSSQQRIDAIHNETRPSNALLTQNLVRAQAEYYFSDANLKTDRLMQQLLSNPEHVGWLHIDELMRMPMIARLTTDREVVVAALAESDFLEFDAEKSQLRRPGHVVPAPELFMRDLRRSIFFYGLPKEFDNSAMVNVVKLYGVVRRIHWEQPDDPEGPDPEIAKIIMKYKLKQPSAEEIMAMEDYDPDKPYPARPNITERELNKLKTCFVVFDAQSQANKAVKAYRHQIAIKAITKYEFGKLEKKIVQSHLRGEEPEIYASTGSRRSTLSFEALQLRKSEASIRRSSMMRGLNPMALEFDPSVMEQFAKRKDGSRIIPGQAPMVKDSEFLPSRKGSKAFYMVQENTSEARADRTKRKSGMSAGQRDSFRASVIRRSTLGLAELPRKFSGPAVKVDPMTGQPITSTGTAHMKTGHGMTKVDRAKRLSQLR